MTEKRQAKPQVAGEADSLLGRALEGFGRDRYCLVGSAVAYRPSRARDRRRLACRRPARAGRCRGGPSGLVAGKGDCDANWAVCSSAPRSIRISARRRAKSCTFSASRPRSSRFWPIKRKMTTGRIPGLRSPGRTSPGRFAQLRDRPAALEGTAATDCSWAKQSSRSVPALGRRQPPACRRNDERRSCVRLRPDPRCPRPRRRRSLVREKLLDGTDVRARA